MMAEFFKELALNRRIEFLDVLCSFLHRYVTSIRIILCYFFLNFRHVSRKQCGKWHSAYSKILNTMQEGMVMRYGNTLLVPVGFSCCANK